MPPNGCETSFVDDITEFSMELDLGELPEEMYELAKEELGETPEKRSESLLKIRDMIQGLQSQLHHFPYLSLLICCRPTLYSGELLSDKADLACRMDDDFLIRFLRARRFCVERAYNLVSCTTFNLNGLTFHYAR